MRELEVMLAQLPNLRNFDGTPSFVGLPFSSFQGKSSSKKAEESQELHADAEASTPATKLFAATRALDDEDEQFSQAVDKVGMLLNQSGNFSAVQATIMPSGVQSVEMATIPLN